MVFSIVIDSESFELNFFFAILPVCGMLSSRAWSDPIHVVRTFFSPETETAEKLRIAATNFYVSVSGRWTPVTRIGFRGARWKFSTRPVETDWALTSCSWIIAGCGGCRVLGGPAAAAGAECQVGRARYCECTPWPAPAQCTSNNLHNLTPDQTVDRDSMAFLHSVGRGIPR